MQHPVAHIIEYRRRHYILAIALPAALPCASALPLRRTRWSGWDYRQATEPTLLSLATYCNALDGPAFSSLRHLCTSAVGTGYTESGLDCKNRRIFSSTSVLHGLNQSK
jgi:hypothetical protein